MKNKGVIDDYLYFWPAQLELPLTQVGRLLVQIVSAGIV